MNEFFVFYRIDGAQGEAVLGPFKGTAAAQRAASRLRLHARPLRWRIEEIKKEVPYHGR